jgi:hypothetical protein
MGTTWSMTGLSSLEELGEAREAIARAHGEPSAARVDLAAR